MDLIVVGVGDAFSELHYGTCLLADAEGALLMIDCPHPVRKMLREAEAKSGRSLSLERLAGVVVTHLHADHASGLESLGYYAFFVLHRRLPLYVHPEVAKRLWEGHLAAGMESLLFAAGGEPVHLGLHDYFDVRLLDEQGVVEAGPFSIACRKTIHHIPTFALRISAGGRTLGCSADTAFDPSLIAWLDAADLVVHETNHGIHTPYADLAGLPEALRKKMRLNHYPDDFDTAGSAIAVLREGEVVAVLPSEALG